MKNNDKARNGDSAKVPRWKRLSPVEITPRGPVDRHDPSTGERLQKILAQAGIASRRAAEELIAAGRVTLNGEVVKEMGVRADPALDTIAVDGKPLQLRTEAGQSRKFVYIAVNKPMGIVSTAKDPEGRPTVLSLLAGAKLAEQGLRVYPVGRLDTDSTGLLLLTNDGDLTFRLTHPRYGVEKEYRVVVRGRPNAEALRRLREGVAIEGEMTAPAKVDVLSRAEGNTTLRITIHEGRKRQVRLMTSAVGHPVIELTRVRFGPIELGDLQPGKWRNLATHEAHALRKAVKLKPAAQAQVASLAQPAASQQAPARSRPTRRVGDAQPAWSDKPEGRDRRRPPAPPGERQGARRTTRTPVRDGQRTTSTAPGARRGTSPPRRPDRSTATGTPPAPRSTRTRRSEPSRGPTPRQSPAGRDNKPFRSRERGPGTARPGSGRSTGMSRGTGGTPRTDKPRSAPQRGRPGSSAPRSNSPNRRRDR